MERGSSSSNVDMFDWLSIELLVLIASFLPFKEAVRNSVLSRQWRHVWRETKSMEFDEEMFVRRNDPQETQQVQRDTFVGFVRKFIANYRQTDVWKFSLTISRPQDYAHDVSQFIQFAVSRGLKHLQLDFSDPTWDQNGAVGPGQGFPVPEEVYQLGNLEFLKLHWCNVDVSRFTSLQFLKVLSLGWIYLTMDIVRDLVVSCPILYHMTLKQCQEIAGLQIAIPNSKIKYLVMDNCMLHFLHIDGPELWKFCYSGLVTPFNIGDQPDLVECHFDFGLQDQFEESFFLYDLLEQLCDVSVMTVCSVFLQIVPSGGEPLHTELDLNVRHLTMSTALHANEFIGIKFMLASCPYMNTLTLRLGPGKIFDDYEAPYDINPENFWSQTAIVETCLWYSLQVLNVAEFRGTPNEINLIEYIIRFGRRLKRVNLYFPITEVKNDQDFAEFRARANPLMEAPRANLKLEISMSKNFLP